MIFLLNKNNHLNLINKENLFLNISTLEFEEKIIEIKRIIKVVTGGKKLSFRIITIVGDLHGKIGYGIGRGDDVNSAVNKSILNAKKNLILIPLTLNYSIPYLINLSYNSAKIKLIPTKFNTGIIANKVIRSIFELAGIKNIVTKQLGSKSILNNIKVTFMALLKLNEKIEKIKFRNKIQKNNNYLKNYYIY